MEDVQVFEYVHLEATSRATGRCEVGHSPDAASRYSAASSARFVALFLC